MPRDHGKPSVTIFWFAENSWEPSFISFNVKKHVFKRTSKLKNISVYYYLQKTSMSFKMSEEGQFEYVCALKCQKLRTPL